MRPKGLTWKRWKLSRKRYLRRRGLADPTNWNAEWDACGGISSADLAVPEPEDETLAGRMRMLELECKRLRGMALSSAMVRNEILKINHAKPPVPAWMAKGIKPGQASGNVPTLLATDWHWGEVIDPEQIGGVNEYNLSIAHVRARTLIDNAVDLLKNHMVNPSYPGIVFALGGDMFSGDIHEELSRTNEQPLMPVFLDLLGVLIKAIGVLADEFGAVFVPCVTGNHSRTTMKPIAKGRVYSNFDWLLYQLLDKHFEDDDRVSFLIPDGPDAHYQIYGHAYLLTHGDQFRGGSGIAGPLMTIARGDHKKRTRNSAVGLGYKTMVLGHWHQLIQMGQTLVVNGSLCGYNEYCWANNFSYEPPQQALWITNEHRGITFQMPVQVESKKVAASKGWVSVFK